MNKSRNVRTATLEKYISGGNIKLNAADREFLRDLSRVHVIDEKDVSAFHYNDRKNPSRRLERLCEVGVLEKIKVGQPGRGRFNAYIFSSDKVAALFGGKKLETASRRNALHEVITSRLYFTLGRPETFTVESQFSKRQKDLFKLNAPSLTDRMSAIPDATYLDGNGEIVVVEADSGQYNKRQIISKQMAWKGYKQVWGQPSRASARVTGAEVYRFA